MTKKRIIITTALALLAVGGWLVKTRKIELLSPLGRKTELKKEKEIKVVGFLPTWMVGKTKLYTKEIDELVFLGVEVGEEGALVWNTQSNKINSEAYVKQKTEITRNGGKNIVGVNLFDDKTLNKVFEDDEARKNLVAEIKTLVTVGRFDGVNIDFEWAGDPLKPTSVEMEGFLKDLREAGVGSISIDVYANTIIKGGKESLERLSGAVDDVIVMAYDFSRPGSDFAASVAPIGAPEGKRSISEVTNRIVELGLNRKKFVLAYPLYGYEWKTTTAEAGAETLPGVGSMASFARVQNILSEGKRELKTYWDDAAMTPWLSFIESEAVSRTVWVKSGKTRKKKTVTEQVDRIHQIHYEDLRSLKIKIDLAKQTQVGGVGFWALGYEGDYGGVWDLVAR